jgi:hypothetical protein
MNRPGLSTATRVSPRWTRSSFSICMLVSRLENLVSDRRLIEHCSLRLDILYFLGYEVDEDLPWHSTVSRTRQLYPAAIFEQLFDHVFAQCVAAGLVTGYTQAVDSAFVEADYFTCPAGNLLPFKNFDSDQDGRLSKRYSASSRDCRRCPLKPSCVPKSYEA